MTIEGARPDSYEWLADGLRYVDRWLGHQMRLTAQPGCSIAVEHAETSVYERAFGTATLVQARELTPRHRFRVASHSKAFTAAGIMLLREQARLRLDDAVTQHVTGLPDSLADVTIGQLLSHSSGLTANGDDQSYWNDLTPWPDEAALRRQLEQPLKLDPGEQHKYSNIGYGLVGLVLEAITAEPYGEWITREVISRAGLQNTTPDFSDSAGTPFAHGHASKLPLGRFVIPGTNVTRALAPATGFVSTARDLARFFGQLDPAATTSFLSKSSRLEMTRRHWKSVPSSTETYYGLGIASGSIEGHDYFGHRGSFQGYQSRTCVIPDMRLTISVITNAIDGTAGEWLDAVAHILHHFSNAEATDPALRDWQGRWWNQWMAVDLVPLGKKVIFTSSDSQTPFAEPEEIEVLTPTHGRVARSEGHSLFGEAADRLVAADGTTRAIRVGGDEYLNEAEFFDQMRSIYDLSVPE